MSIRDILLKIISDSIQVKEVYYYLLGKWVDLRYDKRFNYYCTKLNHRQIILLNREVVMFLKTKFILVRLKYPNNYFQFSRTSSNVTEDFVHRFYPVKLDLCSVNTKTTLMSTIKNCRMCKYIANKNIDDHIELLRK